MPRQILDFHSEIEIPEVVGPPHEVDGQNHQATEPGTGGDVGEKFSTNCGRHMFDHADGVGAVKRWLGGYLAKGAVPRAVGKSSRAVVKKVPFVPLRLWWPGADGRRRIDGVHHIAPAGQERCQRRDSGADVDQPTPGREMVSDQLRRDGVLPQARGVVGIEPCCTTGVHAHGDERQRIRVAVHQIRQRGGLKVAWMLVQRGPEDHEDPNGAVHHHRIDLRIGSNLVQGGREGLGELGRRAEDAARYPVTSDDEGLTRRPPQMTHQIPVPRPIHRVVQLVEANDEVGLGAGLDAGA